MKILEDELIYKQKDETFSQLSKFSSKSSQESVFFDLISEDESDNDSNKEFKEINFEIAENLDDRFSVFSVDSV